MGIRAITTAVLLSLIQGAAGTVLAQTPGIGNLPGFGGDSFESDEVLPRFRVEVLAFAHDAFDPDEEIFPDEPYVILMDTTPPEFLVSLPPGASPSEAMTLESDAEAGPPEEYKLQPTFAERFIASLLLVEDPPEELDTELLSPYPPDPNLVGPPEPFNPDAFDPLELFGREVAESTELVAADMQYPVEPEEVKPPPAFRFLRADELELQSAMRTLDRAGAYTTLAHGGWVQIAHPPEQAVPIDLERLGVVNPVGSVQLHLSRFLHVTVDLVYRATPSYWTAQATAGSNGLEELKLPPRYALRTQRRVRSGEIHYFDHPAIGVLVVIKPQPLEVEDAADSLSPPIEPAA